MRLTSSALVMALWLIPSLAGRAGAQTFTSAGGLKVPGQPGETRGPADPYPSTIEVSGITGTVSKITVTLTHISHTFPTDLDILLESPAGRTVMIMSDCGGGAGVTDLTVTLDDGAAFKLPDSVALSAGTFRPTDFGVNGDQLPGPAPQRPFSGTKLEALATGSVNGTWRLWVADDSDNDTGRIGGWSISFAVAKDSRVRQ